MNFQEFIAAKTAELEQIDRAYRRTRNDIEAAKTIELNVALVKESIKDLLKSTEGLPNAVKIAVNEALLEELTIITPIEVKARVREDSDQVTVITPILNEVYDIEPYAFVETRIETVEHSVEHSIVEPETVATESSDTSEQTVEVETVADVASADETEEKKPRRKTARGFQRKCGEWQELLPKIKTGQELDRIKEEMKEWGNYEPPTELIDALDATQNRISTTFKPSDLVDESGVYLGDIPDENETVTEPTPQSEFLTFKAALENALTLEEHQEVCNKIREADMVSAFMNIELIHTIQTTREKFEVRKEAEKQQNEVVTTKVVDAPPTPTPTPVEAEKPKSPFAGRSVRKKETVVAPVANEGISLGGIDTNTVIKIKNLSGVPVDVTRHSEDYILPVGTKVYDSVIDCAYSVCDWDEAELMNSAINKDTNKIPVVSLFDDRVYLVLGDLNKIVLVSDEEAKQLVEAYKKKVEAISSGDVFA